MEQDWTVCLDWAPAQREAPALELEVLDCGQSQEVPDCEPSPEPPECELSPEAWCVEPAQVAPDL